MSPVIDQKETFPVPTFEDALEGLRYTLLEADWLRLMPDARKPSFDPKELAYARYFMDRMAQLAQAIPEIRRAWDQ